MLGLEVCRSEDYAFWRGFLAGLYSRGLADRLEERLARVSALLLEAEEEILAHMDFPTEHWKEISSTNPLERLNKETNRRSRVVGILPTEKSLIRLIGAVLAEQNDEWALARTYMSRHSLARIYQQATPEIEGEVPHAFAIPVHYRLS